MNKLSIVFQIFVIFIITFKAYSFSSSSYLIANHAMLIFDFEEANIQYDTSGFNDFNMLDLEIVPVSLLKSLPVAILLESNSVRRAPKVSPFD